MLKHYYSATQINVANYCSFRYYLRYVLGKEPLRLSAYVKGSLLHSIKEHFWDRLGSEEEVMSKSSKFKDKKYFDAETFVKYAEGKWKRIIVADQMSDKKIHWNYEQEKWVTLGKMKNICSPLFGFLLEKREPLFVELPFDFFVGDRRIKGRIDEIRQQENKIVVIDAKSGNPWVGDMKLKHDPQLTIYAAGICAKLRGDVNFARKFGLEGRVEEFMEGKQFISPNIDVGFFMLEALGVNPEKVNSMPSPIVFSKREDNHLLEVLKMIDGVKQRCIDGDVYPERGKKCDSCDLNHHCDKELENVNKGWMADKTGQLNFTFALPEYIRREDYTKKVKQPKRDPNQTRMRFSYKKK
jgi:hypothetical protein